MFLPRASLSLSLQGAPAMNASQLVHCRQSLQSLATDLRQLAVQAEALIEILETETKDGDEHRRECGRNSPQRLLERTTFTVHWGKKSCFLGYTLPYRVMDYLARHANHYVSHEQLLDEVWGGQRSSSAVRSVVALLRTRLTRAGLGKLALAIDGTNSGHYALLLPTEPTPAESN